ncbi:MAG TPA: amino acid-binding protein [Candidatus Paceibacterota bacterium]|nr:amino acid-binding protein [Candidatus Paceibacterota bacterium]HRZ58471.1 amino acid-binding protein [Candidatus Paceibacterota bacterium]
MALKVGRVDTWVASLEDKPGNLAAKLNALAKAGVNLEFVLARRAPDQPGTGVVFVTPIKGAAGCRAARQEGFRKTKSLHAVRIEGPDKAGQGARVTQALGEQGLNLRGLSAAAVGKNFVTHIAFDTAADAAKAMRILRGL